MRALISYGIAGLIIVLVAVWLGTGNLIVGGQGPGKGETPIIGIIEGKSDGPIAKSLEDAGVIAETEHDEEASDPALTIAERNAATTGADVALQSVRTVTYNVKPMALQVPLRGRTQAKSQVTAVAQTSAIIDAVHVTKGQRVAIGDKLCTLDQGTRAAAVTQAEAGLAQAKAGLVQAQLDYDTNAALRGKGLAPSNSGRGLEVALSAAQANLSSAQAGLDNAIAELDRTEILAKVDGVVQDPVANAGAMLAMGEPCASIVQLDPMVFVGQVPEARIGLAKTGLTAKITTINDQSVEGKVSYVSASADDATRSFPIEIEFPNPDGKIKDGVTATAVVDMGSAPAHLLPQSALTLNNDGDLGLRAVEDNKVKFYPVQIVSDTREGVWVLGLPPKLDVIVLGQEYVTDGQAVDPTNVPESAAL